MRPLVILENDAAAGEGLRWTLIAAGFRAELFDTAEAALPRLRSLGCALAIIDIGIDGAFEICREASALLPVIAITPCNSDELCIRAFESGADDCICRPIVERELVARVRNVLRRSHESATEYDEVTAMVSEMRVRVADEVRDLTAGETAVLATLLEHAPTPMTALQIAHAIGANRRTVESRIKGLRKKLGPGRLVSRGAFGYQLAV